jgi:hypothetical protein
MRKSGLTRLPHQLLGQSQSAVRAHHRQRRDMAVRDAVRGLFLHLGENVAYDLRRVVGGLGRTGDLRQC